MRVMQRILVVAVVLAAGVWAYRANVSSARATMDMSTRIGSGSTPFPVMLAAVERGQIAGSVSYTGSVAAFNEEDVFPRVMGRIVEMPVYPGDAVKPGQAVARLDDVELSSRVREAEAMAATSRASAAQMEADALAARQGTAQMEREAAMAEADLVTARYGAVQMEKEVAMTEADASYQQSVAARDAQLLAKGALSQQEAENSQSMAAAARARVQAAQAKAEQGKAMVVAAEARLGAAKARLEQGRAMEAASRKKLEAAEAMVAQGTAAAKTAQVVRDYVNITASTSGYVVKRLVAPGVLVQPGMPILKIAQIDKVRLQANVGEKDLQSIRVGSPVIVTGIGNAAQPVTLQVTSVFPFVDPGARTAVVEAVAENSGRRFLPGQYVSMQFVTGERTGALSVPRGAVVRMGGKATVWVARDERTEPREVTVGLDNADRVEIVAGLQPGEKVVTSGQDGLYAGARVAVLSDGAAAAHGAAQLPEARKSEPAAQIPASSHAGHGAGTVVAQAGGGAAGDLQLSLTTVPAPPKAGNTRFRIVVKDGAGSPVAEAKVELKTSMPGMAGPKATAKATKDAGVYEASANLAMGGSWTIEVTATPPQGGAKTAKFDIEVK